MVMLVLPSELDEVISVMPATRPSCLSSGVATEEAMISALAPGKPALMLMVGKSTCGSGEAGNTVNAIAPVIAMATVKSVVATGRRINGVETLMLARETDWYRRCWFFLCSWRSDLRVGQRRCK